MRDEPAADRDANGGESGSWKWGRLVLIVAALGAISANVFRTPPLQSANDRSRWCTVESLLSGEGYVIDEIDRDPAWSTIDKVRHEGHFYSTKPPLLPTLVAGITWGVERVSGLDLRDDPDDVVPWVLVFVNVLPLALLLAVITWFAERMARSEFSATFVVATAALGTLLVPFTSTLNNHTIAACAVGVALAAAARILLDDVRRNWVFAICGFAAAFAVVNELPAAAFGLAIFVVLHLRDARQTWAFFVPAALVPLVAYLALNVVVTGGLKPFYAGYGTEKYVYVHEGVPSYWANPGGIDTSDESPPVYLFHCLVGHHGIFSLSPVFLLTLAGWWFWLRPTPADERDDPLRRLSSLGWMGLGLTLVVLGFYLSRTSNYNYGGISAGLRWTIWLIPFWLIALPPALDCVRSPPLRSVALGLLFVSAFSAWTSARSPWDHPWLFDLLENAGWIDYSDPEPTLDEPLHTIIGSLPGTDDDQRSRWIEFRSFTRDGKESLLRFTDNGPGADGRHEVVVRFGAAGVQSSLLVDPAGLRADVPPESVPRAVGLPARATFRARAIRYVRTPLRRDAFECLFAMASVDHRAEPDGPMLRHYAETWLTDEVPFGTVKFSTTVVNLETGELVSKQVWTAVDASDYPVESPLVVEPPR